MSYYFFFFKQKTAYELRMSDWSSDVCSSDLRDRNLSRADGGPSQGSGLPLCRDRRLLCAGRPARRPDRRIAQRERGRRRPGRACRRISEERRLGQGCVRTWGSLWSPSHSQITVLMILVRVLYLYLTP